MHRGLYNGNIAWMVTDLPKLGQLANDRAKGMQGMLYGYDQLNRIVQSRSLTSYQASSGFAARAGVSSSAYDEDYSYDGNGNLLSLQRRDEAGALQDDFHYQYYAGSNKLREVKAVTQDKTIGSGSVKQDNIRYRNLTLTGSSYVSPGRLVEVKALEKIQLSPQFRSAQGTDFWAHLVDDGTFQYDGIGNLILDQDEGVKISWTPYGKIREVSVKGDSLVTRFRYDAMGNRVEKRVLLADTTYALTRYLRDASGNVMAIYQDTTLTEQPLYGSSRLGEYRGGVAVGTRRLGRRHYELSNHLGNVLAVVSDQVGMQTDSVWATVASTNDYYPFGLTMKGRTWGDTTGYRYGFNGKEKDNEGMGGGGSTYDYGFRIYNPRLAKFLSVDPLTKVYPWYTPYQFAGNTPIQAIDVDGAEPLTMVDTHGKLTKPMITLLNSSFNFSKSSLIETNWVPWNSSLTSRAWSAMVGLPSRGPNASVSGKNVYHDADEKRSSKKWLDLIAHEQSHRNEINNIGNLEFYGQYVSEGISNPYRQISTEQRAYKIGLDAFNNSDYTDLLAAYRGGIALSILNSDMSEEAKSQSLEGVGSQFRRDVIIPDLISSIDKQLNTVLDKILNKKTTDKKESDFDNQTFKQLESTRENLVKEQKNITKKYGE